MHHTASWWAPSSKHAKRTAVGTAAIVVALSLITWTVWASPSGPVSTAVHHALGVDTAAEKTARKAATADALQVKLDAAQQQIWKLEGQLHTANTSGASRAEQIATLQQQLRSAQSALGSAKAAAASIGTGGAGAAAGSRAGGASHTVTAGTKPAATGTAGPSRTPTASTPVAPTKAEVLAQQSRWYGLYTAQSPFNWAEYDQVSRQVGTATNMDGYFQGFDQAFNASAVQRSWANGRLPVMTWETTPALSGNDAPYVAGYTNADIMGPAFKDYITQYAKAVAANGQPMVIRFDHEMNGTWYNWSEGAPRKDPVTGAVTYPNAKGSYVAMWQYVHTIFQEQGANDYVIWDWSPSRIDKLGNKDRMTPAYLAAYYPGPEYVDWVGMSGYYRSATETPTFANTFGATLAQVRGIAPGKGIFLAEIGATESGTTTQKAAWLSSLFDALADPANDDVIGFAYFSEVATTYVDGVRSTNDWRLNSRPDSLAAFAAGMRRTDTNFDLQEVTQ
ncbi:glycoside hydrolase family 26 protein [Curtobacterium sp. RRHDQ10]|uniref:glycoside hydrolase family 26 protein n=1 Tax=Curtobacterium phyllosphaerae TaxID=3413379 RepID=UPI003BF0E20C